MKKHIYKLNAMNNLGLIVTDCFTVKARTEADAIAQFKNKLKCDRIGYVSINCTLYR